MANQSLRLGYLQQQMYDFLAKTGRTHCVASDHKTVRIAKSIERRGLIKLIDCGMRTATGRTVYMAHVASQS
jgi:hypothetical protein